MATRGSYVHNSLVKLSGASPQKIVFMQFSQNIAGFTQLQLIQLYRRNPLEKLFSFAIYQNYTLALI